MMKMELNLVVKKNKDLTDHELSEIIALCSRVFNTDFTPYTELYRAAPHVFGYHDGIIVSHACWVTRWLQVSGCKQMRTAYVEGVATEEACRNRGFASVVMNRLAEEIAGYDIGGLATGSPGFYSRLGWQVWKGPLFIRKDGQLISTPNGPVMVLPLPKTPEINLTLPLSAEWREWEWW